VQAKDIVNIYNKIIAENSPNIEKEMITQIQEAFRTLSRECQKRTSPHHIRVKTLCI
jgi:hypothetical protein